MNIKPTRHNLETSNKYCLVKDNELLLGTIYYVSKLDLRDETVAFLGESGLAELTSYYNLFIFYKELKKTPKGNKFI